MGFGSLGQTLQTQTSWGIGLHDPETLKKVLLAKIWWRWLKESSNPWAKLWKQKYAKD